MQINTKRIRSLYRDGTGKMETYPTSAATISQTQASQIKSTAPMAVGIGKSSQQDLSQSPEDIKMGMETATGNTGSASSNIGPIDVYAPLMTGYLNIEGNQDQQGNREGQDTGIYEIYRDIYKMDSTCGSAVDMMSNMPFSDFSLGGAKDAKFLIPYEESIDNLHIRSLFPPLSVEYLVQGLFCGTTMFSDADKHYKGIIPQNVDYIDVTSMPIWGQDPLITLRIGDALEKLTRQQNKKGNKTNPTNGTQDERLKTIMDMLPEEYRTGKGKDATHTPEPEDVIYIPRGGLFRDTRGVSIFQRILPYWIMEKAMYRGTVDQAMKRQKSISHMVVGDEEWEPTTSEMTQLAQMLLQADLDPVGAVFVTRNGVNVSDIRTAGDFWKVSDLTDFFTTMKIRAMGISETFLTGDASYNSLEQVMTVFVEQLRAYRERVTSEIFYERLFPRISTAWGYSNKKNGLVMETAGSDPNQMSLFNDVNKQVPHAYMELAMEQNNFGKVSYRNREMLIPQVHWHKRLRPEADDAYLGMLGTLAAQGVPIPVRLWAAAGGIDFQSLVNQKDDDISIRDNLQDWIKKIAKTVGAVQPPMPEGEGGGGFPGGGDAGGGADEFASLITSAVLPKPKSILSREYGDQYEVQNRTSDGKRHLLSARGKAVLDERINKSMASTASAINRKVNAMEKKMEDQFNEMHKTMKRYFMSA